MRIGIDARLIEETGVGRYIRNLIHSLALQDDQNEYVIFLRKKSFDTFTLPNTRWEKRLAEVAWHTIAEQLVMPGVLRNAHLDIVHIPYHNPPIFYSGAMIITIHDLTILHFNTGKATTLPPFIYALKRLGYLLELAIGLHRARAIIAVSQTTKKEIMDHFGIASPKIFVTYEGVDETLIVENKKTTVTERLIPDPYFLYVGNAYPHKNLDLLMHGFAKYKGTSKLVLVGRDDYFYGKLKATVKTLNLENRVVFFGYANDKQLHTLYLYAKTLVFPSRMEGFGLPALEALALGTPVLCSDIPIFHEILGDDVSYMNSSSASAIAEALTEAAKSTKAKSNDNKKRITKYNWETMAQQTRTIYESSNRL